MQYLLAFGLAFALTAAFTPLVRRFALARGIVDHPSSARKIHRQAIAYLGGVAIFAGFLIAVTVFLPLSRQLGSLIVGCLILVVVGVLDDMYDLKPGIKLVAQFVAAGVALAGGIGITAITNPFGGVIDLSWGRTAFTLFGETFHITPIANALSLIWMVGLANTINFLDGLDGLACGVSGIAALVMFAVALGVGQAPVALLAIILAGSAFGFLPFNFHPARIFMGDSGAYFLGLIIAMLSIYSGAKLATAALVLGLPILDATWAVVRRLLRGRSPFKADRQHFHHLLIDSGLSQTRAVLVIYAVVATFGMVALWAGSFAKFLALVGLVVLVMGAMAILFWRSERLKRAAGTSRS